MPIPSPAKNPRKSAKSALSAFHLILLLLLTLPPRPAHAQGSGNWRTYTTADCLLSNNIQALAYRADPLDFPTCDPTSTPPMAMITLIYPTRMDALLSDHQGHLWIATTIRLTSPDDLLR